MSTDRETTRIVRSWLEEGVTALPDPVLDAVLDQLATTPQRRFTWWPARRIPTMSNAAKLAVSAAAVAVVAFIGISTFGGANPGGGLDSPTPSPTPTASPSPTPVALSGQDPLAAGRYLVEPALPMDVSIEVPEGWSAGDSWVVRGPKGNEAPDGMAIRFYWGEDLNLYVDPLVPGDGVLDPPVGTAVEDMVTAIVDHPDWTVSETDSVTLDGYSGEVVHVTLPEGTSDATPFYLFGSPRYQVYGWEPGQEFDIYIVDVAGERLFIDAFRYPGTSATDLAAQQAVLDSIQIEAP